MKESKYNFFLDIEDNPNQILAYNSRTNALALIKKEDQAKITSIIAGKSNETNKKLIEDLKYGGFLIEDDLDELKLLHYRQEVDRYNTNALGLTIAPTLGCNFDCIYCYEHSHDDFSKMGQDIQDAIVDLVDKQKDTLQSLDVAWYGGEPLLAFDVIEKLSEKFITLCEANKIAYSAGIITNGYLLTTEKGKRMKDLKINRIQVTIDGPEDTHNERRSLRGKKPTFQTIFNNLKALPDDVPEIYLRINTDIKNASRVLEIIQLLKDNDLLQKINPYLGYVESTNEEYDLDQCLPLNCFTQIDSEFYAKLRQQSKDISYLSKYPYLLGNYCGADRMNSFVIEPNGDMCKCWSDVGLPEYRIGNIKEGITKYTKLLDYALYDPTQDSACKECKLLPICVGGCPRRRIDAKTERCSNYRYTLENILKKAANELIAEKRKDKLILAAKA